MRLPALLVFLSTSAFAADWPQFLGPDRTGKAADSEPPLPVSFPGDLPRLWQKSVGAGFAGSVIIGSQVIAFHREGSDMTTEAVDLLTGKVLWRTTYISDYVDSFGFDNGPRATPAVAGGKVFTFGPEGRATALDLSNGKELWHYDTAAALGSEQGFFGRAPSPLVLGDKVIFCSGGQLEGKPAGLIALDVTTGKPLWSAVDDEAGYASPVPCQGGVLAWMRNQLWSVDAMGRVRASLPLRSSMDASVNAASPLACGQERWLVSAGYGVGAHLFQLTETGVIKPLWHCEDALDCHYATPVRVRDHLYGFHGRQESGMHLRCLDLATGKVLWEAPDSVPGGTLLTVGDHLLIVTERGELWIVRANPDKFEQLATIQILRAGHRSHAAYSNGILVARDAEQLVAVRLRPE